MHRIRPLLTIWPVAALLTASALSASGVGPQAQLVASGPGFARILFQAPAPAAASLPPEALHAHVGTALVGVPLDGEVDLHVLDARVAATVAVSGPVEDLQLQGPATMGEPAMMRHQRVVPLAFGPRQSAGNAVAVYDRVLVEVRFAADAGSPPARVDGFESSYEATLINYPQARRWRARRPAARPAQSGLLPEDGWFRVVVRSDGIYRVTAAELEAAGADLSDVDPDAIRMLYGGGLTLGLATQPSPGITLRPLAVVVDDGGDGRFRGDDYILFHGVAPERWDWGASVGYIWRKNLYTKDNVYWIDLHGPGQERRALNAHGATDRAADAVVEAYRDRLHDEDEHLILRQLEGINSGYDWFWDTFTGNARNFTFVVDNAVSGLPAFVRVHFFGWTSATHVFELRWNDRDLGRFSFTDSEPFTIRTRVDAGPQDGLNQLGLFHRDNSATRLDWYEVDFVRRLVARGGELVFAWPGPDDGLDIDPATAAVLEFRLRGFPGSDGAPRIFEISQGLRELAGFDYDAAAGTVAFQDEAGAAGPRRYVAVQRTRWKRPAAIVRDSHRRLRDAGNGAEYVIVTHADFAAAAQRLADWRAADDRFGPPLTARVVDVQDIYDEFSGGLLDPMAIRAFVNYAVDTWQIPPVYITLFGDGTYDHKNNSGVSHTNWIPPYQDTQSTYDEWYVRVEGNDALPDLAVSRLAVQTPAEAGALVDKILRYDQAPEPGPWQARILLVADDVSNPQQRQHFESYFIDDAELLSRRMMPEDLDMTKLYIGAYPLEGRTKPKARDEFLRQFNDGALILTYLGHGNPEVLAHEQVFLLSRDAGRIDNGDRLPFIYTAASQVGVFDDPMRESMPETLVKMPDRGAIGFISATRVGFHNSNMVLARQFHAQMYRSGRQDVPLGLALMEAKQLVAVSTLFRTNIQRYSLLGDAAQRLARPRLSVQLSLPDSLEALMELEVQGVVVDAAGQRQAAYDGQALVRVFDSTARSEVEGLPYEQLGAPLFRGRVQVRDGRFQTRLRIPKDITYRAAQGRASAYVTGADGAEPAFGSRRGLILEGTAPDVVPDEVGPTIRLAFASSPGFRSGDFVSTRPVLAAVLADDSGINITGETGHEIELRLDGEVSAVTDFYTSVDDHRQGLVEVPLGELEPGQHTIRLKAWDSFNNSAVAEATFVVAESSATALTDALFHPNPTPGDGHFTYTLAAEARSVRIRVFAISGRQVAEIEGTANLGYNQIAFPGAGLAGGTYLYRLEASLEEGSRVSASGPIQVVR